MSPGVEGIAGLVGSGVKRRFGAMAATVGPISPELGGELRVNRQEAYLRGSV